MGFQSAAIPAVVSVINIRNRIQLLLFREILRQLVYRVIVILRFLRQTFQISRRPLQVSLAFLNLNQIRIGKDFRYRIIRYTAVSGNIYKDK